MPVTRDVVARYIAGETVDDAIDVCRGLVARGLYATVDHLGEDVTDASQADAAADACIAFVRRLGDEGLADRVEVSLKLSALGQFLVDKGELRALANARRLCATAADVGTMVTIDMENHTTTDSTLRLTHLLREDYPWVGSVLQAQLRRTESDVERLRSHPLVGVVTGEGPVRVRLCKGAYAAPADVAYVRKLDVDLSYVRCLRTLMAGDGYPMVATHDPRLIAIAADLATRTGRTSDDWEYQMLYGIRPDEQQRLADEGHRVRVYVPYGADWYGYFVRRLAERPANLAFLVRSVIGRA